MFLFIVVHKPSGLI